MEPASLRVLVVDDFAPWQNFVERYFERYSNLRVVGFAGDGSEAIKKAEELQPDLVVLDIGLPKTNGIDAARQIRKLLPSSAILFLSEASDPEIVEEALAAGGCGFVLKKEAAKDLAIGTEAVLCGQSFLSQGLMHYEEMAL